MPGARRPVPGGAESGGLTAPAPLARLAALSAFRAGAGHEQSQVRRVACCPRAERISLPAPALRWPAGSW